MRRKDERGNKWIGMSGSKEEIAQKIKGNVEDMTQDSILSSYYTNVPLKQNKNNNKKHKQHTCMCIDKELLHSFSNNITTSKAFNESHKSRVKRTRDHTPVEQRQHKY